ncbi:peptidyl-tRNA hydrolase [Erythrobacter sp. NAP1]|uniref:hypothetical protein n=1 Tax=Erythrobacter sp. NAP1 TaxID=237727 RepID=UPI0000686A61|nr:hypothetical protein [Erythrobacter sp. NAP1]EAQ30120.1 peptidyl-tRNA hydrolase [Erythrobacter sp. NAP1]
MEGFDYVVLFLAIPVGLALADMAQGLSVAMRRRGEFTIGWLTPLLVLFILVLTSILLESFYEVRDIVGADAPVLFIGLVYTFAFYVAASFVFPESFEPGISLDDWFMEKRRYSLGVTSVLVLITFFLFLMGRSSSVATQPVVFAIVLAAFLLIFFLPIFLALRAKTKPGALIAMIGLNGLYLLAAASIVISR